MSQIGNDSIPVPSQHTSPPQTTGEAGTAPLDELRNVRPSGLQIAARVVGGIFTLGISEGIIALVKHFSHHAAPQPRVVPPSTPPARPTADVINHELATSVAKNTLAPDYQAAVQDGIADLRAAFGSTILKEGVTLKDMPQRHQLKSALEKALRASSEEVTPAQLRTMVKELGLPMMAEEVLAERAANYAEQIGHASLPGILRDSLLQELPDLAKALHAAGNHQDATAVLARFQSNIEARLDLSKELADLSAQEKERAVTELAQGMGLSVERIRQHGGFTDFVNKLGYFTNDVYNGTKQLRGEALRAGIQEITDKFVQNKLQLFHSVDMLPLSPDLADAWKSQALESTTLHRGDLFTTFHILGSRVDASKLLDMLRAPEGEYSPREITGYLESLALQLHEQLMVYYGPEGWSQLGGDGQADARFFTAQAMMDSVDGLRDALRGQGALIDAINGLASEDLDQALLTMDSRQGSTQLQAGTLYQAGSLVRFMLMDKPRPAMEQNQQLALALGRPDMPPVHTIALDQAILETRIHFGEDCLPNGSAAEPMGTRDILGKAWDPIAHDSARASLEKSIRESDVVVSAGGLASLAATTLHHAAVHGTTRSLLREMAQNMGLSPLPSPSNLDTLVGHLAARHADFWTTLGTAQNRIEVAQKLQEFPEINAMLWVESDIQAAWSNAMTHVYTSLSAVTGRPESELRTTLNVVSLENASFLYLQKDLRDACANPATSVENFPSSEHIANSYQALADTYVARISALHTSVAALELSPKAKAEWQEEALTNHSLKSGDFLTLCYEVGSAMRGASISHALEDSDMSDQDILGLFQSLGVQLDELAHQIFTVERYADFGSDELQAINHFAMQAFIDKNPDLLKTVAAHRDRLQGLVSTLEDQLITIQRNMTRVQWGTEQQLQQEREYGVTAMACQLIMTLTQ